MHSKLSVGCLLRSKWRPILNQNSVIRGIKTLKVDVSSTGVMTITFDRPKKKNAFTWPMYNELAYTLKSGGNDKNVRVALLTGSGDFYSSGNDLSNFSQVIHPLKMAANAKVLLENFVNSFIDFPKPLICAVNGPAIGIAVTSLGLCDRVFASTTSHYRTPFADLGQSPEGCSSFMFPKLMGDEIANEVLWKGRKLNAEEAHKYGLIHEVHSPEALMTAAIAHCEKLAALPIGSEELKRYIIKENLVEKLHAVNKEECAILEKKWVSPECFNALAAFLDSRNMRTQATMLRLANATGFLWGQPK
eukprot:gene6673-13513_t